MNPLARWTAILVAICLAGCTSFQAVPDWPSAVADPAPAPYGIFSPGTTLRVTTRSSEALVLVVRGRESGLLLGDIVGTDQLARIPISSIVKVEQQQPTVLAYAGVLVATLAMYAILFALIDVVVAHGL